MFGHTDMEYRDFSKKQPTAMYEPNADMCGYAKLSVAILEQAQRDHEFLEKAEDRNANIKTYCRYNYLLSCFDPLTYLKNKNNPARMYLESKNIKTVCIDNWAKTKKRTK